MFITNSNTEYLVTIKTLPLRTVDVFNKPISPINYYKQGGASEKLQLWQLVLGFTNPLKHQTSSAHKTYNCPRVIFFQSN